MCAGVTILTVLFLHFPHRCFRFLIIIPPLQERVRDNNSYWHPQSEKDLNKWCSMTSSTQSLCQASLFTVLAHSCSLPHAWDLKLKIFFRMLRWWFAQMPNMTHSGSEREEVQSDINSLFTMTSLSCIIDSLEQIALQISIRLKWCSSHALKGDTVLSFIETTW